MRNRKQKAEQAEKKEYPVIEITSLEILKVKDFEKYTVFDAEINGIRIYGLRIVEGRNGEFIAFPAEKGKDGNYYNRVWFKADEAVTTAIISAVDNFEG